MGDGVRIVVVEPSEVVRRGLGAMLDALPDVVEWRSFASVPDLPDGAIGSGDVLLLSVSAVDTVGAFGAVGVAGAEGRELPVPPAVRTIVLISSTDARELERATAARANGYMLLADIDERSLQTALTQVRHDAMPLPEAVSSFLLRRARGDDPLGVWRSVRLSPREREVLGLLAEGRSNQEIASELKISIHSAKRHVSSILHKLDSPSRAHLVAIALRSGVVGAGRV